MEKVIDEMISLEKRKKFYKETVSRARCLLYACKGDGEKAKEIITAELKHLPSKAREKLLNITQNLCGQLYYEHELFEAMDT